jgi:hypothetical protein
MVTGVGKENKMNMRHIMIFLVSFGVTFGISQWVHAEAPKKEDEKMLCVTNEELDKIMVSKNYDILLNMTNPDGIVESVWTGGQNIVITAAVPKENKSCLLTTMTSVTYNPKAIEEVWETYKKQTKQKDI